MSSLSKRLFPAVLVVIATCVACDSEKAVTDPEDVDRPPGIDVSHDSATSEADWFSVRVLRWEPGIGFNWFCGVCRGSTDCSRWGVGTYTGELLVLEVTADSVAPLIEERCNSDGVSRYVVYLRCTAWLVEDTLGNWDAAWVYKDCTPPTLRAKECPGVAGGMRAVPRI